MTRINFTGRRRITRKLVDLQLRSTDGPPRLDLVRLDLSDLGLPEEAPIVVEAYRRANYTRLDAGTVGELDLPRGEPLPEFESATEPLFRIKVVGAGEDEGKLLAVADQLRAHVPDEEDEGPQASLLSVAPNDLGQRLWKLDLTDDHPQILVNNRIADWKGFASTPEFHAFVLPEVLRQITQWVIEGMDEDIDDEETPRAMWMRLMADTLGRDPHDARDMDSTDLDSWMDNTVDEFCSRHALLERYEETSEVGE